MSSSSGRKQQGSGQPLVVFGRQLDGRTRQREREREGGRSVFGRRALAANGKMHLLCCFPFLLAAHSAQLCTRAAPKVWQCSMQSSSIRCTLGPLLRACSLWRTFCALSAQKHNWPVHKSRSRTAAHSLLQLRGPSKFANFASKFRPQSGLLGTKCSSSGGQLHTPFTFELVSQLR